MKNKIGIFISHTWKDKAFARRLAIDLGKAGATVWFDEGEIKIGDSLLTTISKGIEKMDYLVVILSPESVESNWVKVELKMAMHEEVVFEKVKVLPILYKKCDLPYFLKHKLYADFRSEENYGESINQLISNLGLTTKSISPGNYDLKMIRRSQELHIEDIKGENVKLIEKTVFEATKTGIDSYTESVQADGSIRDIIISPGTFVNQYTEEGMLYLISEFGTILNKGDRIKRTFQCVFVDTFTDDNCYWIKQPSDPIEQLSVIIKFPKERYFNRFFTSKKTSRYETKCEYKAKKDVIEGHPSLVWTLENPDPEAKYKIEWFW